MRYNRLESGDGELKDDISPHSSHEMIIICLDFIAMSETCLVVVCSHNNSIAVL